VFRDQFRKFLAKDLAPHTDKWRTQENGRSFRLAGVG